MGMWRRHAIYFAPDPGSALHCFGAGWFARDPATGAAVPGREIPGLPLPRAEIVATPARYGLHATLKAPFRLAGGVEAGDLDLAAAAITGLCPAFALHLKVARLGNFVALVPDGPAPAGLGALERALVIGLDRLRAPLTPEEVARRGPLGPAEAAALARWGYPYVLEAFRFHITLTGALPEDAAGAARDALAVALAPLLATPLRFAAAFRFSEAEDGLFREVARYPLADC